MSNGANIPDITRVVRIDLSAFEGDELLNEIHRHCNSLYLDDFRLAGTFTFHVQLILIFQKK